MFNRLLPGLALLGLVALPSAGRSAPAAEKKSDTPALVVRVQSFDVLLNNFRYLAGLVGRDEEAKQLEGILSGTKVLDGIDAKRPLALYASFGEGGIFDSPAIGLVPISDEKAFLGLVENLGAKTEKDDEGVYSVTADKLKVPVFFRFANKHAYLTVLDKKFIAKDKLLMPSAVLGEGKLPLASATIRIDQIPENFRNIAVDEVEGKFKVAKDENKDKETPAQHAAKVAILERIEKYVVSAIKEGGGLSLRLDVDQKAKELRAELGLTAKDGSPLGKLITDLGKQKSVVAGLVGRNSVGSIAIDIPNDEKMAKAIQTALKEALKQGAEKETDPQKKAVMEKVHKAIEPAIEITDVDSAFDLRGPDKNGLFTVIGGVKVADGAKLEKAIREVVNTLQPKNEDAVKLDAEKAGDVSIHRIAGKVIPPDAKKTLGEGDAYFAVRSDALFFTVGEEGLAALKEALKVQPKTVSALHAELSVARIAQAMSKERPEAPKAAAKAFGEDKDNDKVRVSLEGGRELTLRFVMKTPVLTFLHLMEPGANK